VLLLCHYLLVLLPYTAETCGDRKSANENKLHLRRKHLKKPPWPYSTNELVSTERLPLVGEVSASLCGYRVPGGQGDGSLRSYSRISKPEPLFCLSSSSAIVLTRLSGLRSDPSLLRKSGSAGNRNRTSCSVVTNSDH
jgi:hypothetical protein